MDVPELTPTIINEYIKKIIVYAPDKSSDHQQQKYRLSGIFSKKSIFRTTEKTFVSQEALKMHRPA